MANNSDRRYSAQVLRKIGIFDEGANLGKLGSEKVQACPAIKMKSVHRTLGSKSLLRSVVLMPSAKKGGAGTHGVGAPDESLP
jgi:hypothetical protein